MVKVGTKKKTSDEKSSGDSWVELAARAVAACQQAKSMKILSPTILELGVYLLSIYPCNDLHVYLQSHVHNHNTKLAVSNAPAVA